MLMRRALIALVVVLMLPNAALQAQWFVNVGVGPFIKIPFNSDPLGEESGLPIGISATLPAFGYQLNNHIAVRFAGGLNYFQEKGSAFFLTNIIQMWNGHGTILYNLFEVENTPYIFCNIGWSYTEFKQFDADGLSTYKVGSMSAPIFAIGIGYQKQIAKDLRLFGELNFTHIFTDGKKYNFTGLIPLQIGLSWQF